MRLACVLAGMTSVCQPLDLFITLAWKAAAVISSFIGERQSRSCASNQRVSMSSKENLGPVDVLLAQVSSTEAEAQYPKVQPEFGK